MLENPVKKNIYTNTIKMACMKQVVVNVIQYVEVKTRHTEHITHIRQNKYTGENTAPILSA
jgi:hypothetical protein